jgi:hypothetical protein
MFGSIEEIADADAFFFNLRHPVERMISWYNYEHPDSCMDDRVTERSCDTAREIEDYPDGRAAIFYRQCFPTQEYLPLLALNYTGSTNLTESCSDLARKVLRGKIFETGFKHMFYNMHFYAKQTINKYPDRPILVVRTESLWDDTRDIDVMLGGKGTFGGAEGTKDSHGSEKYKKGNDQLSKSDYGLLCCALKREMQIYHDLVERAANLPNRVKDSTIANTAEKCGFSTWDEMMAHCTNQ